MTANYIFGFLSLFVESMSNVEGLRALFIKADKIIGNAIKNRDNILVISHYDADGLSAVSLFIKYLMEKGASFQVKFVEQIYPVVLDKISLKDYDTIILVDLGSGYKDFLLERMSNKQVVIFDHHIPQGEIKSDKVLEINPYKHGVDASTEISASGLVYMFFKENSYIARSFVHLALVGALGDRQDNGPKFSLSGLNKDILVEAKSYGIVEEYLGLRLFGISHRPLVRALAYTMDPYIPGLSGNEAACYNFLKKINIEPKQGDKLRDYKSLSLEEIKTLATELIKYLLTNGVPLHEAERIFGYSYYLTKEPPTSPLRDLREYAYMLNALGRMEYYETAVALNIGIRGQYFVRALDALREYRHKLSKAISTVLDNMDKLAFMGKNSLILNLDEMIPPKFTGPLASMLSVLIPSKYRERVKIIGVLTSFDEEYVKISFRRLVDEIDVGRLLYDLSQKIGGTGGGHPAAGGIFIEKNKIQKLYEYL